MESYKGNSKGGSRLSLVTRTLRILAIAALLAACFGANCVYAANTAPKKADSPIVSKCKSDLAKRLKMSAAYCDLVKVQPVNWPNAALGMPVPGKMYAQQITPGSRIILEAKGTRYIYTTSKKAIRYGGPESLWSCSMLYLQPIKNEPNLNSDLYQCSLLGTNCVRIASGVSDYYPQQKGVVLAKQRTSRSGHDLLLIKADRTGKTTKLYSAMDFGAAAINDAGNQWAAFVRPRLGFEWNIVVAPIGKDTSAAKTLPLPDGVKPGPIAWSGDNILILTKNEDRPVAFETSPKAETPEWKPVGAYLFPGLSDYMLNKSESLEISQVTENGKPAVEVVSLWFTGDRTEIAKIDGLTMGGSELMQGFAIIWGIKDSKPAVYTIDISTEEVIPALTGIGQNPKPFAYPPLSTPAASKKAK